MHTNKIEIRIMNYSDIIANEVTLIDLLEQNFRMNFPNFESEKIFFRNTYSEILDYINNGTAIIFGAFSNLKFVGLLWAYKRSFLNKQTIHINHIIIQDTFRSCGIGSMLLERLFEYVKNEKISKIDLMATINNTKAINFYKSKGFYATRVQLEKDM